VIDEGGSCAKLRRATLPDEVVEAQKRVSLNQQRAENAITNHEFEKARYYSDEEKVEREGLRAMRQKYQIDESQSVPVTVDDIEAVISRWTGTSLDVIRKACPPREEQHPPKA
jgi:ATP-dependent Clp protease ATP-binding subunit ClpC